MKGALAAVLLVAACHHDGELATGHIVVRDAAGQVTAELRAMPYGFRSRPGEVRIVVGPGGIDAGEVQYENGRLLSRAAPRAQTERAKVERSPGKIALFDPLRAPLGQIVDRDGKTWVFDPGGMPLGIAKADGDRVVLTDRDGGAKGYVTGLPQQAAAVFLLSGMSELEKEVLAIALFRQ